MKLTKRQLREWRKKSKAAPTVDDGDPLKKDFRKFLFVIWNHLGLGAPSQLQYDMAWTLQHGSDREMLAAFRGAAKSWITVAFVLWVLYCDPQKKILVISASEPLAKDFTTFAFQLIHEVPELAHLKPRRNQRQGAMSFDVGPSRPAKDPSVTAKGITGQITGTRAHLIVLDDAEVPRNSATPAMREDLLKKTKETTAIVLPKGRIIYLGTFQTHSSIYKTLPGRGYNTTIYPVQVPTEKEALRYGPALAPYIRRLMKTHKPGDTVEPRFTKEDLAKRRLDWGLDGYKLQFLLDTHLSDDEMHPLKLRDLIVLGAIDRERAPNHLVYAAESRTEQLDLPEMGFEGDRYYGPGFVSEAYSEFSEIIMVIDPSGQGADETAFAILGELHGFVYLLKVGGFRDGYSPTTLQALAALCVEFKVGKAYPEDNFGDGMWTALWTPVLTQTWERANKGKRPEEQTGTTIEPYKAGQTSKEERILSGIGPALRSHRVVTSRDVIMEDYNEAERRETDDWQTYSAFYQLTHITRERGSLSRDDRLEVIAKGVEIFTPAIGVSTEAAAAETEMEKQLEELEKLFGGDGLPGEGGREGDVGGIPFRGGSDGHRLH